MIISILIPIYNEATTLPELLRRVRSATLPNDWVHEIILIDDGSTDGTSALLDPIRSSPRTIMPGALQCFSI